MKLRISKIPHILCPKCSGIGKIELPEILVETLDLIRKHGPITNVELHKKLPDITPQGVGQRTKDLLEAGIITRQKHKRSWKFSVVTKTKK